VINLVGVAVPRVLLPELAERLIHAGFNGTASRLLDASAEGRAKLELTHAERGELLAVLEHPPEGLEELCRVLRDEGAAEAINRERRTEWPVDALPAT